MRTCSRCDDVSAPELSGRYSTPAAAPDRALLVAYSPGPVVRTGNSGSVNRPRPDSGIHRIDRADVVRVLSPRGLVRVVDDPAYNEMYLGCGNGPRQGRCLRPWAAPGNVARY